MEHLVYPIRAMGVIGGLALLAALPIGVLALFTLLGLFASPVVSGESREYQSDNIVIMCVTMCVTMCAMVGVIGVIALEGSGRRSGGRNRRPR
mmetsp:Transcript_31394/g.57493  ORF Transcript_31394/g.57493 Transcript_31394/m.57493 type:complete len:93 (+) Transcript_31394:651-929(+)